jgi:hypothetical protein
LFNAERYAEQTYQSLKDTKNAIEQESEVVAHGAYNLADVIRRQVGDLIKAGKLARESLHIRTHLYGANDQFVGASSMLLTKVLLGKNELGDETKELFERLLAI